MKNVSKPTNVIKLRALNVTRPDDADLMHGLPTSLQLVAQRFQEEKVLAMANNVLEILSH
jgi:Asp-tRNA(Asn)/Glu-tRNA(Gln) amidotransferase A subunit family amidase